MIVYYYARAADVSDSDEHGPIVRQATATEETATPVQRNVDIRKVL